MRKTTTRMKVQMAVITILVVSLCTDRGGDPLGLLDWASVYQRELASMLFHFTYLVILVSNVCVLVHLVRVAQREEGTVKERVS